MKSAFSTLFLILIFLQIISGKDSSSYTTFTKISLFRSDRQAIERLFKYESIKEVLQYNYPNWLYSQDQIEDPKKNPEGYYSVYYRLKDSSLDITYSKGRCSDKNKRGYDLEKDVVIGATLDFYDSVKMSKLNLDSRKFIKTELNSDLVGEFSYDSEDLGIHLSGVGEYVGIIEYSPLPIQIEKYSCQKLSTGAKSPVK